MLHRNTLRTNPRHGTSFQNSLHMPHSSVFVLFAWVVSRARAFGGEETPAVLETRPLQCCGSLHFLAENHGHAHGEQSNSRCKAN